MVRNVENIVQPVKSGLGSNASEEILLADTDKAVNSLTSIKFQEVQIDYGVRSWIGLGYKPYHVLK